MLSLPPFSAVPPSDAFSEPPTDQGLFAMEERKAEAGDGCEKYQEQPPWATAEDAA